MSDTDTSTATPATTADSTVTLPPPMRARTMFGRRCRYGALLAFVVKEYTEAELTVSENGRTFRLVDAEKGPLYDLLAFDANGIARPVKSVHIDDADWVE